MINKLRNIFVLSFVAIYIIGCATPGVPYSFMSTYEPEMLPKVDNSELGTNSIAGSAFLRQGGGGIVNCAGNTVLLKKQVSLNISRNAYAREYLALSSKDKKVTSVDPRLIAFEADLQGIRSSFNRRSACDIDGKFKFSNLSPGTYKISTKVYWVVMDEGQGGIMGTTLTIPENSDNQEYSAIVNTVTRSCSGMFGGLYCNVN
jgi:hypothetical protein